ncbi:hypothetical protein EJ03DRAFT_259015, partial [Teratosphaeria nubilosa]
MADLNHLFGSCSCERNQYTVVIPASSASIAQVFFDNSATNRRVQASPVTAWLRVPLEWYHSSTYAHFPDETHASIKRSFETPTSNALFPPTRRQFCGFCGTHLTAWNEGLPGLQTSANYVDVTLGSLLNESLEKLEQLQIYGDLESESDDGLVTGGRVSNEDHIPSNEHEAGNIDPPRASNLTAGTVSSSARPRPDHRMSGRGLPYFEEMVENSRLGRIKRQKGGHTSSDGRTTVQWEIVEIGGEDEEMGDA